MLNRDDLADAFQPRLAELDRHRSAVFPEILSLLLQLANRPAQFSKVDRIPRPEPEEEQQLTWNDFEASGAAYCEEDIWDNVDYGAESSSDDGISSESSETPPSQGFHIVSEHDYVIPDDIFSSGEDEVLVNSIKDEQFWRHDNGKGVSERGKIPTKVITELQMVREAVFMLQGLPTSLLWRLDGSVEVDRRYSVSHLSQEALGSLLASISTCGSKIDTLRRFARTPQSAACMQTFHRSAEDCLQKFDKFLSDFQSQFLSNSSTPVISLLQLSDDVQRESKLLVLLADLVSNLEQDPAANGVQCLDLLFDLVCLTQAAGDDESFASLAHIFFSSFQTYARPLRRWMETGQLEASRLSFFVSEHREKNDLRTLWHDWYTFDSQATNLPKFVRPFAHKIFIAGKSMVFLKRLNMTEHLETPQTTLHFEDIYPSDSTFCLPFHALLETAFSKVVDENHSFTSSLLRQELNEQCGLWISLQALEHIFLCKNISLIAPVDTKVFEMIDRGKGGWSDRFLLTELAQNAFSSPPFIDPTRVIVRSTREADNCNRSVKILSSLYFDYILPWPVANIITKDGIAAYQRISTFLMQIRRARYTIVKQRLQYSHHNADQASNPRGTNLSYALRHNLIWFLNVLYSHLTSFVISSATESLRKSLSTASDVDAMIATHRAHMASLEGQCLLSENLHPLYQATLTLLDLCISFADLHARRSSHTSHPGRSRHQKHHNTRASDSESESEFDSDSDSGEFSDSDDAHSHSGHQDASHSHPRRPLHESQYIHHLKDIQDQFTRLVAFLAAGLKGIGRVDGQVSWEMLAEELEWRKERAGAVLGGLS